MSSAEQKPVIYAHVFTTGFKGSLHLVANFATRVFFVFLVSVLTHTSKYSFLQVLHLLTRDKMGKCSAVVTAGYPV